MTIRRGPASSGDESRGRRLFAVSSNGAPPVRRSVRNARMAGVPVAFAGRRAVGVGKRALGRSAAEVDREIQLRTAQHIFEVLGELKGCAAKLGQLLAIYELALPPELAEPYKIALSRLHDAAPAMLPGAVDTAMTASMGPDWRWYFREFDDRRAAAASIGQVHRAVWRDGTPVAVKVMYPGGRAAVAGDLEQLRRFTGLASVFLPGADIIGVLDAITECVLEELDYAAEARYQEAFAAAFADDPDIRVPRVIARHGDVLISEWLDGTPVTRVVESGSQAERDRVGMLMVRFVASAWSRSGLLYGDPHPGNFRVLPDGRLGVVDFGACAVWPPEGFDEMAQECVRAVFRGGPPELEAATRRYGFAEPGRAFDAEALFTTIAPCTEPFEHDTYRLSTRWLRKHVLRLTNPRLSNVLRQLSLPAYITPFARSMLTLIAALCQLGTEGPYRAEIARWFPELDEIAHGAADEQPVASAVTPLFRDQETVSAPVG
ncbi:ABC1 kinase family protein [Nocardia xishanensis]